MRELVASNDALQEKLVEVNETAEEQKEQQIYEMDECITCLEDTLSVTKESLDKKAYTLDEASKEMLETKSAFEREMDQVKDVFRTEMAEKDLGITTRGKRIRVLEAESSRARETLEVEKASALELLQFGEATKEDRNALEGGLYNTWETIAEKDREILIRDERIQSLEAESLGMKEREAAETKTAEATKGLEEENAQLKGRISYIEHDIVAKLDVQKAKVESKTRCIQQLEQELEDAKASLTMKNGEIARRVQSDTEIAQLRRRVSMAENLMKKVGCMITLRVRVM
ncbi:hypothetical protein VKT23_008583 [Stygiomarasmius scandens]|uniref:Uncharacterized protein n=1 Tax=Marasmiellus scandens TaxID=2682957 RepID=A0ABR1JHX9_9AGAR